MGRTLTSLIFASLLVSLASAAAAAEIRVPSGQSVQAALDGASDGDVIVLERGRYEGDLDFGGKAVTVRGVGPKTVLRGSGDGPVVTFANGEDERSVLDSVTVTGGVAERGGGISIVGAGPCVVRCVVRRNRARAQGSGIYAAAGSQALIYNNLVIYNRREGSGDPHGIEIVDSSPVVVNNTIVRTDSNGLILRGASGAVVANNVFALNGSRVGRRLRGRGICDFSGGRAFLFNNFFRRNRIAALLRDGRDWKRVERFETQVPDPQVRGNRDAAPGFRRAPPRRERAARPRHFALLRRARARDAGHDDPGCDDADGSQNDVGHTGGPFAAGSPAVPDRAGCLAVPPE